MKKLECTPQENQKLVFPFFRETDSKTGVTLLTMNNPKKLNGWTGPMMMAVRITMAELAKDPNTKVHETAPFWQLFAHSHVLLPAEYNPLGDY